MQRGSKAQPPEPGAAAMQQQDPRERLLLRTAGKQDGPAAEMVSPEMKRAPSYDGALLL